ncbi:WG repeat-containing protein [uncultured Roseovarius sp.]|uniref:WG repeat-containing protein n=1 Tax=uncultured Roseovarius sp. TaxID=293344 RepID=UPI00262E2473|nr:WG repeat-containing protein [uncultured Roseovarius sp.]
MGREFLCTAFAWASAVLGVATAGAAAQPCGAPDDTERAPLYPLPQGAEWGYVGGDGEWRLAPEWRQVRPFSDGVAAVETDTGWGLIDRTGAYIVEPGARDADRVVIAKETFALSPFKPMSEGCSAFTPADGAPRYVTRDGDTWIPRAFADRNVVDIGGFSDGLAWARIAGEGVGWINTDGTMAIAPEFVEGGDFVGGRAPAAVNTENRGYIDRSGDLVFPRKFILQEAGRYANGRAPVRLNREVGYMGTSDWVIREISGLDGSTREIDAAAPFADGRAAVRPGPVWIDSGGAVAVDPQAGARLTICNEARLPAYQDGLLPLVVGNGTNICGNPPDIRYAGPGDLRSGPDRMLWHLPWSRDKLVWLDRDGAEVIDSTACRRAPGVAALPVETDNGDLTAGAYRMALSGTVEGDVAPRRADAPCNRSDFTMDGNQATNAEGPWSLSLAGMAAWNGETVDLTLSMGLPKGIGVGRHEIGPTSSDDLPSAYLWMSVRDEGPNAPSPATYTSQKGGSLTLERRDQAAISGAVEITFVSRDDPGDEITLSARFNQIPYDVGAEVILVETTGAVTALDKSMPDDPLINFFTPARAVERNDRLVLSLGKFGPKLELDFPTGYVGPFNAGPNAPVSITFADVEVAADGRLERSDGRLAGEVTARLGAHDQVDGAGSVTVRFAEIPVETAK